MVTMPTATGFVGGRSPNSRVMEKKRPAAKENAAIQSRAAAMRRGRVAGLIGLECMRVRGCELRVASCGLRVTGSCEFAGLRVTRGPPPGPAPAPEPEPGLSFALH